MSIQWTIVAGFLYFEIALVSLLTFPILSPRRWQRVFKSRFFSALQSQARFYYYILLFMLVLMLLDAIREMSKYGNAQHTTESAQHGIQSEMQNQMRLFRSQRNFYISGFALFLSMVIYRLVWLLSSLAQAQAQNEASMKQAQGASAAARTILNQTVDAGQNVANEAHEKQVSKLKEQIKQLEGSLEKEKLDAQALKKQAEATNKEYDRLTAEYSKLEKKVAVSGGGDKKDD